MQGLFLELANMDDGFLLCWVGLGSFKFYVKCMWGVVRVGSLFCMCGVFERTMVQFPHKLLIIYKKIHEHWLCFSHSFVRASTCWIAIGTLALVQKWGAFH